MEKDRHLSWIFGFFTPLSTFSKACPSSIVYIFYHNLIQGFWGIQPSSIVPLLVSTSKGNGRYNNDWRRPVWKLLMETDGCVSVVVYQQLMLLPLQNIRANWLNKWFNFLFGISYQSYLSQLITFHKPPPKTHSKSIPIISHLKSKGSKWK